MIPSTLGANRRDYHQTDLTPDTYRNGNTAKVLINSYRDNYLDGYGQQTFDYDPEKTTDNWNFLGNDGNFNGSMPTMSWRDYDGSGQQRVQQAGYNPGDGADAMLVGSGPNPYARKTMHKLWSQGTFARTYKTDQTMIKPYSGDETGLSYDIDIDHSESPQVRMQRNILEHERSLNRMQKQRQKPDTFQNNTDDMRAGPMSRPYSFNGSADSNAGKQFARHSRQMGGTPGAPNEYPMVGDQPDGMVAKQGIWHDMRERNETVMKRLRIAVDGDIAYERNTPGRAVVDSGKRAPPGDAYIPQDSNERANDQAEIGRAPATHGTQIADLQAQAQLYDQRKAENLMNRITTNSTLETPRMAVYQYDSRKLFEKQAAGMAMRNLMEAKARDLDIRNDIEVEELRLNQMRLSIQGRAAGPVMGIAPTDTNFHDTRQVAKVLANNLRDPGTPVGDTRTDMQLLETRLRADNSHLSASEFVTMSGKVLGTMAAHDERKTENRGVADLEDPGSKRAETQAASAFYESRQTPNAVSQMAKNAGRAIADSSNTRGDANKWDERKTQEQLARTLADPHIVDRDAGEQPILAAHETVSRAAKYRGGNMDGVKGGSSDMGSRGSDHLGGVIPRR